MQPKLLPSTVCSSVGDETIQGTSRVIDGSLCSEWELRLLEEIRDDTPALERFDVDENKKDPDKETRSVSYDGDLRTSEHPPHFVSFGFPVGDIYFDTSQQRTMSGNDSIKGKNLNETASTLVMSTESNYHNKDMSFPGSVGSVSMDAFGFPLNLNSPSKSVQNAPEKFDKCCQALESPSSRSKSVPSAHMMHDDLWCDELESSPETTVRSVRSSPDLARFSSNDAALELKPIHESPTLESEPNSPTTVETDPEFVIYDKLLAVSLTLDETEANTESIGQKPPVSISVEDDAFDANESSIEIEQLFQFNNFTEVNNDSFEMPKIRSACWPQKSLPKVSPSEMQQCTDDVLLTDVLPWKEIEWKKMEKTWEARMWQFVDKVEDRFLRCGFVVGLHDQRGTDYKGRENVGFRSVSLDITQSTISEQDKSMSFDHYGDDEYPSPAGVF